MPERRLGAFILESQLGRGGMGVVYRATYTKTGQQVALKVLPPDNMENDKLVARFDRELKIMKKLKHPHIVQCYGGATQGSQRYYAMEIVEGGSLAERLEERGRLSWEEVIAYGKQICEALEYAHENGVIHRDLKPANLLLTKSGKLKLTDFGIARDQGATALTADGRTVGTFAYMAPEQIRGDNSISPRTDLYALGCVMFELLTGKPPFEADTPGRVFFMHLEQAPPRVSSIALDCPIWLDGLINALLEKKPEHRPMDATTVQMSLLEVEEKVRSQASMTQHAASGQPTTLAATSDVATAKQLLRKKKRRKKDKSPFYEKMPFLLGCLAVVAMVFAWALWPLSEDKMFARAEVLMATDDSIEWSRAREMYLDPILKSNPKTKYADRIQQYVDKIEMSNAELRIDMNRKRGSAPKNEGESLYIQAHAYEQFSDNVTALEKYRSMIHLLQDREESRPYVNLARRQITRIESQAGSQDRFEIVREKLEEADKLYAEGNTIKARSIWNSIITLYETNQELKPQVKRAKSRLSDKNKKSKDEDEEEVVDDKQG